MKRDPFVNPIPLGKPACGGSWKYTAERGYVIAEPNFWKLAKRIVEYRKANNFKEAVVDYEQVQMDVLIANRKRCGYQTETKMTPGMLETAVPSPVQQYLQKRPGCRSCGRRGK